MTFVFAAAIYVIIRAPAAIVIHADIARTDAPTIYAAVAGYTRYGPFVAAAFGVAWLTMRVCGLRTLTYVHAVAATGAVSAIAGLGDWVYTCFIVAHNVVVALAHTSGALIRELTVAIALIAFGRAVATSRPNISLARFAILGLSVALLTLADTFGADGITETASFYEWRSQIPRLPGTLYTLLLVPATALIVIASGLPRTSPDASSSLGAAASDQSP